MRTLFPSLLVFIHDRGVSGFDMTTSGFPLPVLLPLNPKLIIDFIFDKSRVVQIYSPIRWPGSRNPLPIIGSYA
jgi:hypothetical protein